MDVSLYNPDICCHLSIYRQKFLPTLETLNLLSRLWKVRRIVPSLASRSSYIMSEMQRNKNHCLEVYAYTPFLFLFRAVWEGRGEAGDRRGKQLHPSVRGLKNTAAVPTSNATLLCNFPCQVLSRHVRIFHASFEKQIHRKSIICFDEAQRTIKMPGLPAVLINFHWNVRFA